MSRALTEYALSFEFYDSDLITDSDHKILVARINITDVIPNNWSHSLQTPIMLAEKNTNASLLIFMILLKNIGVTLRK